MAVEKDPEEIPMDRPPPISPVRGSWVTAAKGELEQSNKELGVQEKGRNEVVDMEGTKNVEVEEGNKVNKSEVGFPASLINPWVRSGSGPASPGRVCPEPEGPVPAFVTWKSSSPPAGIEPGSMTIGPQGSNQ
ncbi:hypothetical protein DY000_02023892 [Brassica cretica]|uniref:Uncharacterized protein n=1 Tax=Brassica cretica TaxID=69181 RepID=A0ABQ7EBS7_BRACR|nr:hypothetical protein DY000_02023892 [Brassica cretica]